MCLPRRSVGAIRSQMVTDYLVFIVFFFCFCFTEQTVGGGAEMNNTGTKETRTFIPGSRKSENLSVPVPFKLN